MMDLYNNYGGNTVIDYSPFREKLAISTQTLNVLCRILNCRVEYIIGYVVF